MSNHAREALAGQTFLVKLGGETIADTAVLQRVLDDVRALTEHGVQVVIMHGGGPQATALSKRLGLTANMVGGRRVTDRDTLDVMKAVLAGQVNVDLVAACRAKAIPAVGLSGVSAGLIDAVKRPPKAVSGSNGVPVDFGYVGDIVGVRQDLLRALLAAGFVPVLNSLGSDAAGEVYNINADAAANAVAIALGVDKLIMITGAPGVLRDKDDPRTRIPTLTSAAARAAIEEGTIVGGMIPKIEESLEALSGGVGAVHIVKVDEPGTILDEVLRGGSRGTELVM
jgi:acetylglutamate kinase